MDDNDDWPALLVRQHGIATRRQLLARGMTANGIRAQVAAHRYVPAHTGVYATFSGPLDLEARRWAAVLACWPCALSHDTAAAILGLRRADVKVDDPIHVVRAYGLSAVRADGVVVHRSRAFAHIVAPGTDPPVVFLAHTALDLAIAEPTARAAMRSLLQSLVTTRLSPAAVRAAIELRRPRRWKQALLDALTYAEGGVTSALEARWTLGVERAHGLPSPHRQSPVDVDGVRRFEDIVYRNGSEETIVRLDGRRFHAEESVNLVDRRRANAAVLAGRRSLVYGWPEVTESPCVTAREVAAVLGCGLRPCARCEWL